MDGSAALAWATTPTFELEYTDSSDGEQRRGSLRDLWSAAFERATPVRSFPSFKGQKNFTGRYYAASMETDVGFESWLERDVAMMLDFDPEVVAFSSQPFWLLWVDEGRKTWRLETPLGALSVSVERSNVCSRVR